MEQLPPRLLEHIAHDEQHAETGVAVGQLGQVVGSLDAADSASRSNADDGDRNG